MYTLPFTTSGDAVTAPPTGKRQISSPFATLTAYTLWSSEPMYATPSATAGEDQTLPPVENTHRESLSSMSKA